jgi:hypothetical protein
MKRNSKPFSVEIKKSHVQVQRHYLLPRHLFATNPVEATKIFQKDEPRVVPEPSAAPRILPSIVDPLWSRSEPIEPVPCALPVHDVQPAQGDGVMAKSQKPRKKAFGTVEQEIASKPLPEAEMPSSSAVSKVAQRRMTKPLAAAAQLPRHERWKGRLHPTVW